MTRTGFYKTNKDSATKYNLNENLFNFVNQTHTGHTSTMHTKIDTHNFIINTEMLNRFQQSMNKLQIMCLNDLYTCACLSIINLYQIAMNECKNKKMHKIVGNFWYDVFFFFIRILVVKDFQFYQDIAFYYVYYIIMSLDILLMHRKLFTILMYSSNCEIHVSVLC